MVEHKSWDHLLPEDDEERLRRVEGMLQSLLEGQAVLGESQAGLAQGQAELIGGQQELLSRTRVLRGEVLRVKSATEEAEPTQVEMTSPNEGRFEGVDVADISFFYHLVAGVFGWGAFSFVDSSRGVEGESLNNFLGLVGIVLVSVFVIGFERFNREHLSPSLSRLTPGMTSALERSPFDVSKVHFLLFLVLIVSALSVSGD